MRGSSASSEVQALLLYLVGAPLILVVLSIKQRRSLISLLRDIRPFFREFERRAPNTISGPGERVGSTTTG
jgi:hypothetical protein